MKGPGRIERLLGTVALEAIAAASRRALRRGDIHEAQHLAAMVMYGNSAHSHMRCLLPDDFHALTGEMLAANRAARGIR